MPTLRILTNAEVPSAERKNLLERASETTAAMLGKPESYVMVSLEEGRPMLFAGSPAPAAYLELKSLGLPEADTPRYSRTLCDLVLETLNIPPERVYIEFANPPRHLFGWNGGTF